MRMRIINKTFFSEPDIKMSYYFFNRQEILEKVKKRYSKGKAAEYYLENTKSQKKRQGIVIRTCQRKKKTKSNRIKRKGIKN